MRSAPRALASCRRIACKRARTGHELPYDGRVRGALVEGIDTACSRSGGAPAVSLMPNTPFKSAATWDLVVSSAIRSYDVNGMPVPDTW
jgi:hypothetical protein